VRYRRAWEHGEMNLSRLAESIFLGVCLFAVGFTITAAVYSSIVSDRVVERGIVPYPNVGTVAVLVSAPLASLAAYGAYRSRRK
jgi:hypothetical protein